MLICLVEITEFDYSSSSKPLSQLYPVFTNARFHITPKGKSLDRIKKNPHDGGPSGYSCNEDAYNIISMCNGCNSLADISVALSTGSDNVDSNITIIKDFLDSIDFAFGLEYLHKQVEKPIPIIGSPSYYLPSHITLELTNNCNLKCRYCYNESGPGKGRHLSDPLEIIEYLSEFGVSVIELSGGEPFLHPEFVDIVYQCCKTFDSTAVLTNGVIINGEILDVFQNYSESLLIQVSLDASNKKSYKEIAGYDFFSSVVSNLKLITETGCFTRVAMTLDDIDNLHQIEEVLIIARNSNATMFSVSPSMPTGRAEGKYFCKCPITLGKEKITLTTRTF